MKKYIKKQKLTCNICLEHETELKCDICTFKSCYDCIIKWSEKSDLCPQCGKYRTFDIEYLDIVDLDYFEGLDPESSSDPDSDPNLDPESSSDPDSDPNPDSDSDSDSDQNQDSDPEDFDFLSHNFVTSFLYCRVPRSNSLSLESLSPESLI
jgi:hypothetical protein